MNSFSHYNQSSAQIYSYASSNENTRCKGSSGEIMRKSGENTVMAADESHQQKWGDRWSKEPYTLRFYGPLSSQKFGVEATVSKIQRSSCTPRWHGERWFRIVCSIYTTKFTSITNDSSKSHGYHLQTAGLRWTSSRRSISLYPSENGRCSQIIENSKIGVSRHLDSSTTTQMAKIMVQYGRPSRSSWRECVRSSFGRTIVGKAIWENPIEIWLGENSKLGMSLCSSWKRIILICVCGWHKIGWKETKHWSDVESTQRRSRFRRTNIFLGSCTLGLHSTTMRNKQTYCGQLQNHVPIANFRGESREITIPSKSSYFFMVLWYGKVMRRNVWNDNVSWQTGRLNNSAKYLLHASMTTTSKKKKQNLLENCQIHALKLFWNAYTWHVLEDLILHGQWTNLHDQSQNGPKLVTNAWIDRYLTFIIHVNTNNIVMWVTLQNNADWDCFKTLILREILRIPDRRLVESCVFSEVARSCQQLGCARNTLPFTQFNGSSNNFSWCGFTHG